jgi:FkbM family methyltransferase
MKLYRNHLLRRVFLPLFARFNPGDVRIRHHYTGDRVRLHSYRHKSYWFHRKQREAETMHLFEQLIPPGATVLDVGGHIGYIALYFASLVGPTGRIYCFEPGANNLPYLRENVGSHPNVTIIEHGVGARNEIRSFYLEDVTGQNNSFVKDFEVFKSNRAFAYASNVTIQEVTVEVITLDDFCRVEGIRPSFVKVDVEGFELEVLEGASEVLRDLRPMLMVEIQRNYGRIEALMQEHGYGMLSPADAALEQDALFASSPTNTFWFHLEAHAARVSAVTGWGPFPPAKDDRKGG